MYLIFINIDQRRPFQLYLGPALAFPLTYDLNV